VVTQVTPSSTIWTLSTAFGIFLYQLSSVLITNAKTGGAGNFALKQIINLSVGILAWYGFGYAFSFGASKDTKQKNAFIGNFVFAIHRIRDPRFNTLSYGYAWFIQTFFYALVCNSIVAGVLGGRSSTTAHVLSTVYVVGFLFPVIAHFVWSPSGWLSAYKSGNKRPVGTIGAVDPAGAGVVHLLGASISLAASFFLKKKDAPKAASEDTLSLTLGGFLQLFAVYSYITGASVSIDETSFTSSGYWNNADAMNGLNPVYSGGLDTANNGLSQLVGRGAVVLTLSISATVLTTLLLESIISKEVNLTQAVNALTVGFAAISSNVYTVEPWAAILGGFVAALFYIGGRRAFKGLKDNDTFAIHGLGGLWGLLFTGVLAKPKFIRDFLGLFVPARLGLSDVSGAAIPFTRHSGVFYPKDKANGKLLGVQILEATAVIAWGFLLGLPLYAILSSAKKLTEKAGEKYAEKTDA